MEDFILQLCLLQYRIGKKASVRNLNLLLRNNKKFTFGRRIRSFKYALEGLLRFIHQVPNARIHIVAGIAVVICGWYLDIMKTEWLVLILCIGIVFITEIINTAIENIRDYISTTYNPNIKIIKDLTAAAVLVGATMSVVIAACIFYLNCW